MRRTFYAPLLLLVACTCAAQTRSAKSKGPDYSLRGGEYALLNNLLLHDADRVEFAGTQQVMVYGKEYTASKFVVESRVTIPTYDSVRCLEEQLCPATEWAEFEVLVGADTSSEIHDAMLARIYRRVSGTARRNPNEETEEHLYYKGGEYLIFQLPLTADLLGRGVKRLVWVDGKFILFKFSRFVFQKGYNYKGIILPYNTNDAMEDFINMRLTLRSRGVKLKTKRLNTSSSAEFLRLYEKGVFKVVPSRIKAGQGYAPEFDKLVESFRFVDGGGRDNSDSARQAEGPFITGPGITGLPLHKPFRPKITLQAALGLAERFIRKEKIDVSASYLSEVKMTFCGVEKDAGGACWLFAWKPESGIPLLNLNITVSMSGNVSRRRD